MNEYEKNNTNIHNRIYQVNNATGVGQNKNTHGGQNQGGETNQVIIEADEESYCQNESPVRERLKHGGIDQLVTMQMQNNQKDLGEVKSAFVTNSPGQQRINQSNAQG